MRGHEVEIEVIVKCENAQMSKGANRPSDSFRENTSLPNYFHDTWKRANIAIYESIPVPEEPSQIPSHFYSQLPSLRKMRALFGLQLITLIITTISSALGADSNSGTCYFVNGDLASTHVPCFPDEVSAGNVSPCCWIANGDVCLDTGICLSSSGMTYQGACTDQNWLSNSCPHRCPDRK
jgi:hypothetical protein